MIEQTCDLGHTEVPREASHDGVDVGEDRVDVSPLLAFGQRAELVLETIEGFGADTKAEASKAEAEEVETFAEVRETRSGLMQRELEPPQHLCDKEPGLDRLLAGGTQHDEVVGVPHVSMTAALEGLVEVVEDEPQLTRFLRATLSAHGYAFLEATSGQQALAEAASRTPDLVLLDLGLPDLDGVEVTRRLREWSRVPVIVISGRGQERDKIEALDAGADDYLTKPFGVGELLARMRVALRNAARTDAGESTFRNGDLCVDLAARRVTVAGVEVRLTRTEYKLLATLARYAGKVVTHRQLLREVWGPGAAERSHYPRVYMGQLRHKLESDPARPRWLETETGVGYRLRVE